MNFLFVLLASLIVYFGVCATVEGLHYNYQKNVPPSFGEDYNNEIWKDNKRPMSQDVVLDESDFASARNTNKDDFPTLFKNKFRILMGKRYDDPEDYYKQPKFYNYQKENIYGSNDDVVEKRKKFRILMGKRDVHEK